MATELAKAYVQIVPSARGITGSITNVLGGESASAGNAAGSSIASAIKGAIAAAGIGTALKNAISEGADLQQSIGGIETLFKGSADTVKDYAKDAFATAGVSANDYMEMVTGFSASLLQSLSGDTQASAEVAHMAMVDMSDNANKMGTDMSLIQNAYQGFAKQNYTMLDNLKLGYGGTKTEMQRLLADAQALTGVEYDISNLADVYSAIHVIQGELDITGTTAKEASSTITGSAQAMKAAFSNLMGNLAMGESIEEPLNDLIETSKTYLIGNLLPAVGNVVSRIPELISTAGTQITSLLNQAASNSDGMVQFAADLVLGIGTNLVLQAPYLAESAAHLVTAVGGSILSADWPTIAQGTITVLRDGLDLAAGEILGTDGNIVGSLVQTIFDGFPTILDVGVDLVLNLCDGLFLALPELLATGIEIVGALVGEILGLVPDLISSGSELLLGLVDGLTDSLPELLLAGNDAILGLIFEIGSYAPDLLEQGITLLGELGAGLILAIPDLVAVVPDIVFGFIDAVMKYDWEGLGDDIIQGIADGIGAAGGILWDAAWSVARSALSAIKEFFGIRSPSRRMRDEVGKFIPAGVAEGITENMDPIDHAMDEMAGVVASKKIRSDIRATASADYMYTVATRHSGSTTDEIADSVAMDLLDVVMAVTTGFEAVIAVLKEILEAIYGIEIGGEILSKVLNKYNQQKLIAQKGGA